MSEPTARPPSPHVRSSLRLALLVLVGACTTTPPIEDLPTRPDAGRRGDSGTPACLVPEEGCACDVSSPIDCYLDATRTATTDVICHRGTRYCRDGLWSGCESIVDYTLDTSSAVVGPPSAANPCDPRNFGNLLTPDPNDAMMGTNTVYDPGRGGITIRSMTSSMAPMGCTPSVTSCPAGYTCGSVSDGCGGTISCGTCAAGTTCGGGGVPFRCGRPADACTPHGCGTANCGPVDDGCGNLTASCGMCVAPQACGVGGMPSQCGNPGGPGRCSAASPPAICSRIPTCPNAMTTPATSATYNFENNAVPTGWTRSGSPQWSVTNATAHGGTYAMRSGAIGDNGSTGLSFTASTASTLTISFWYRVSSETNYDFLRFYIDGVEQNRWSGTIGWTQASFTVNTAGSHTFEWRYTKDVNVSSGSDTVWVDDVVVSTPAATTGTQATTTLRGVVTVPGHDDTATWGAADPLNNVNVYIPGATPTAFTTSVVCESCTPLTGDPVVRTTTDIDGNFTLQGVPCGANIPLVIQLGRWRRQVVIPNVTCCETTTVPSALTHLPRNRSEGDIPRMAMVTGDVDAMECVLRKIGVEDAEFTTSSGAGRVHIFDSNGADAGGGTAAASSLWSSSTSMDPYDMVLLACEGGARARTQTEQQRLIDYANRGGRVFATHYHYTWFTNTWTGVADPTSGAPAPFAQTANWWTESGSTNGTLTATINRSFPRGDTFAQWLYNRGASTTLGQVDVAVVRVDTSSIVPPGQQWLSTTWNVNNYVPQGYACYTSSCGWRCTNPNTCNAGDTCLADHNCYRSVSTPTALPTHYTFDTPIGSPAANQCGRVVFSDFHVENGRNLDWTTFPNECSDGPLTAQERVLEYMLFDLSSCITSSPCIPRTCAGVGRTCGQMADGCGGTVDCGSCAAGDSCGGGGVPGACGHPTCTPVTCASSGTACGVGSDGCGGMISCPCNFYQPTATFTHVYASQPTPCTIDECPAWGGFDYRVDVPAGTYVEFLFQSSDSATGFPSAPTATLRVNPPAMGTSVTGTANVAALLAAAGAPTGRYFLQVQTVLHADASLTRAPTLQSSNVQFTCVPCN